jgi:hypothetical protein
MGYAKVKDVPPGRIAVEFKDVPLVGAVDDDEGSELGDGSEVTMESEDE